LLVAEIGEQVRAAVQALIDMRLRERRTLFWG
jgi:hypothetical protein